MIGRLGSRSHDSRFLEGDLDYSANQDSLAWSDLQSSESPFPPYRPEVLDLHAKPSVGETRLRQGDDEPHRKA